MKMKTSSRKILVAASVISTGAIATIFGSGYLLEKRYSKYAWDPDVPLYEMPEHISIVLPTFNEEKYLSQTLDSLMNQTASGYTDMEVLVVDSQSTDSTREVAARYDTKVITAPKGKLMARDLGVRIARGDVIVATDADTYYTPNFINLLLRHFQDPEVVGVSSPRLYRDWWLKSLYAFGERMDRRFYGSNSAFLRQSYLQCGGFDLSVDQLDVRAMIREEERLFACRLQQSTNPIGRIVWEPYAPAYTSARRWTDPEHRRERKDRERFYREQQQECQCSLIYESLNP